LKEEAEERGSDPVSGKGGNGHERMESVDYRKADVRYGMPKEGK
jgi:hypothetical protein